MKEPGTHMVLYRNGKNKDGANGSLMLFENDQITLCGEEITRGWRLIYKFKELPWAHVLKEKR